MPCKKEYSTGLCEFIENFIKKNKKYHDCKPIITVCGLVGNICVMHSVHQGIIMTKFYETLINAKFIYSALGTLWLTIPEPHQYFDDLSKQHNIMIKGSKDYNKEITFFEGEIIKVLELNNYTNINYDIILSNNDYVNLDYHVGNQIEITG